MSEPPFAFRRRFHDHNVNAAFAAAICAFAAVVLFQFGWIVTRGAILFTVSARDGPDAVEPDWTFQAYLAVLAVLFAWAGIQSWRNRRRGVPDRRVVGFHLIEDFLLILPNTVFSFFGNLQALRFVSGEQLREAWAIYREIAANGKAELSRLGMTQSQREAAARLLFDLQLVGLVQVFMKKEGALYIARDPESEEIKSMLRP